jgi:hypothetical protein
MRAGDPEDRAAKRLLEKIAKAARAELAGETGAPLRLQDDTVDRAGDDADDPGFGWWTRLARPHPRSNGGGDLTLFLDTCVDDPGRLALGVWYSGRWEVIRSAVPGVQRAWRVGALDVYVDGTRTVSKRKRERPNVGEPFIDRWKGLLHAQHIGLYVARSPHISALGALVRDSVEALVRLAEAVASSAEAAPADIDWDAERTRITRDVLARPRQAAFRRALVDELERCVVSGEPCAEALEGAHIDPVLALGTDDPKRNGLLLRADLHRLFDRGWLRIVPGPRDVRVEIDEPILRKSEAYRRLVGPITHDLGKHRLRALAERNRKAASR